ncbi:MAG: hypothetical protein V3T17_07030 [Pseudomonadales bacterium]
MFDTDETSDTFGCGDRYYWGWKLIDFPNGTFQGAAAGLAGLVMEKLLPTEYSEELILQRIDAMFCATQRMMSSYGSLDEALPNEASFCVTGLVAADLLLTVERLVKQISKERKQEWLAVIRPMIQFLHIQDEYHGIISNHLATNALALVRWTDLSGENVDARARVWVDRILRHQSEEGWFMEYDSADPGYQTWCMSSLAGIHQLRPKWDLGNPLRNALDFLSYAAHPNGSFGGIFGSRMTRFIFPAGIEMLAPEVPEAAALANFARESIASHSCVSLDVMDPSNLIPLFNDYVTAALVQKKNDDLGNASVLPCYGGKMRKVWPEAGWLIDSGKDHYTILNLKKGGAGVHTEGNKGTTEICAFVGRDKSGKMVSSQYFDDKATWIIQENQCKLISPLCAVNRPKPDAFRFMILRILSLTIFRSLWGGNWVKRALVRFLVTAKSTSKGQVERTIELGACFSIVDEAPGFVESIPAKGFKPTHMASMGYWQRGE